MKKLVRGILDFRKNVLPHRRELFARLANGQAPDVLFITCSDSRVAPNWFASTDPGDLFVVRNVGNLVPPDDDGSGTDHSVAAAIDFAVNTLNVSDIVVCGHSGCGAMQAIHNGIDKLPSTNLKNWLTFAEKDLRNKNTEIIESSDLRPEDKLSQQNVINQIENLKTYHKIKERMKLGQLKLHAWWFDIARAGVYAFNHRTHQFVLVDDDEVKALFPEAHL